jgi:lysyl-tRNA synthetase class 2
LQTDPLTICPDLEKLALRDRLLRAVRTWFYEQGFMEVQTPVIINEAAPEAFIDTFRTDALKPDAFNCLAPSPELCMKRLVSCGASRIFQIGPVFRRDERGAFHMPEFTMLEWYRKDADYNALMNDCEGIVTSAISALHGSPERLHWQNMEFSCDTPFKRLKVEDAFLMHAGWNPCREPDSERFNHDMAFIVEPSLPACPLFLVDYPCSEASLARLKHDDPALAERVEFYMGRVELANGFSELTDAHEQRARFEEENIKRKKAGLRPYPMPEKFLAALRSMPECAGMAMGIDRLAMLLSNAASVEETMAFPSF